MVWATLSRYGLDPWTYAAIDLGSAAILAVTTPRLVTSLVDRRRRRGAAWGAVTLLGYSIPDVYIFLSTDRLPIVVLVVLIAVIYVSIAIGGLALRRKVVAARALRAKVDLPVAA